MKKYIILSLLLITGQSYTLDTKLALAQLNQLKNLIHNRGFDTTTVNALHKSISDMINYAFQNSKSITGQDMDLAKAASFVENANKKIVTSLMQKNPDLVIINILKPQLENVYNQITFTDVNKKIKRIHITPSKRNAQLVLQNVINFFINVVFAAMEQEQAMRQQFR